METPLVFGEHDNLVGVANVPENPSSDLAVIMLTPGMLHHVGPYGLHVRLAEQLGEQGIASLRYDLSGIGESLAVGFTGTSLERAAKETVQAMDRLESEFGFKKFIIFGLCSGADDSLHAAQTDTRIVGVAMLDGCGYRTGRYYLTKLARHYFPRMFRWDKWKRVLQGGDTPNGTRSLQMGVDIREFPEREVAMSQIESLADRGVRMRFIYTGGVADYYNYAHQFFDMFPALKKIDQITTKYFPTMDHLAMLKEDRSKLLDDLSTWISASA